MSPRILLFVCVTGLLPGAISSRASEPRSGEKDTFWVIPHTHWEGAVFKTREEYLEMGLPNILKAMKLLKEQPEFRFVLDQVAYVKPFLDRYPDQEADFRKFLAEGRLQLVGGLDVMPDVNMPGGETFIRQMQYGKRYYREKLGIDVTTGWLLDTFGHHAQIPQLLALAGYKSFWHQRGVSRNDHPSEFLWEGIDGTRIPAFWLPHSYGLLFNSPREFPKFQEFMKQRFSILTPNSAGHDRVGLAGADVSEPEEHLVPSIKAFNAKADAPFTMRMGVPSEFEAIAAKRSDLPVFRGELNPIFQGTYSSRIELKEWIRTLERKLITAEKLAGLASWLGAPFHETAVWRAWEPVLFNETHDLSSGVMTDHVYEDTVRSYEFSNRLADELIDSSWGVLAAKIDTRGAGTPVVVFNSLGWTRSDITEVDLGFGGHAPRGIDLVDDAGKAVPYPDRTGVAVRRRHPQDGADRLRGSRCTLPGLSGLPRDPKRAADSPTADQIASTNGSGAVRDALLSSGIGSGHRGDQEPASQARGLGGVLRAGQRGGTAARSWRPLGAVPGPGRRQQDRDDDTPGGSQARSGSVQP